MNPPNAYTGVHQLRLEERFGAIERQLAGAIIEFERQGETAIVEVFLRIPAIAAAAPSSPSQ